MEGLVYNSHNGKQPPPEKGEPMRASPEDQQVYTQVMKNAMSVIYDEKIMPQMLRAIRGDGTNPVQGLGQAVAAVLTKLEAAATQAGQPISNEVKAGAAKEMVEILAELAGPKGADLYEFSQEEMKAAFFAASNTYNAAAGGAGGQAAGQAAGQQPGQPGQAQPEQRGLMPQAQPQGMM